MAPSSSSSKPKSISQLRMEGGNREVIDISSDEEDQDSSGGDQYGPPPPPPRARPPPPPQNAVASSSTQYSIPPMKKMFERPKPKMKPKQQQQQQQPKPKASLTSSKPPPPKRRPSPAPAPPSSIASSSSSKDSSSSSEESESSDDEMEEIQLPSASTALAAARADDEEEHPALVLQRQEEEDARAARGEAEGEKRIFKDGKGGNAPPIQIQLGGEEEGGGRNGKGGKKKAKKSLYTPQDRLTHLTAHMIHTISLLANAGHRNRLLNGELLKARLLSLLPPRIPKSFTSIHPRTEPDAAKRARLFDKALASFVDWFAQEFETDYHLGIRGRSWDHSLSLPYPFPSSSPKKKTKTPDRKGKGKAKQQQHDEEEGGGEQEADLSVWGGELIRTEKSLQKRALVMRGSRDVGAQLFVAAARSLGLGVRLVVSLQSVGWRMGDGVKPVSKPKEPKPLPDKDDDGKGEEEEEVDPNKPVRWIDRKEGERFPGLGNRMGVEVGGSGKGKGKEREKEIPAALMIKPRKKGRKLGGGRKGKFGEKVGDVDAPFDPLSAPIFWAEVFSRPDGEWIPVDPIRGFIRRTKDFEPAGEGLRNRMVYVVAFEEDGSAKDLTRKYHSNFHAKVPKLRVGLKLKVGDKGGVDWWGNMMRSMGRGYELQRDITENAVLEKKVKKLGMPTTLAGFKNHPDYVLERDLKVSEVIYPKIQHSVFRGEPVYPRSNVVECRSEETWMRQGREVLRGEEPMKLGKMRAVTINKKREIEASKERGDEMKQELYSLEQTRLYQAPAIKDGKIPRNGYGNIDLFTPTMLPPGAVHLPFKGIAKVAKKLEMSFAEAVTGFEYKKQRAIPVTTGVVVAEENRDILMDAYEAATADAEEREQAKRKARVIKRWQKLVTDLRIRKKLQVEYGKAAAADDSFQAPGGFDQDESRVQEHQFPKAKHITVRVPSEENSRRFEETADQDPPMENNQQPDAWVPRPVEEDRGRISSDEEEEAQDEPQQPVASSSKIILSPGKKLVPKSLEDMLAQQQAVDQDSDLSSTIDDDDEEEEDEHEAPKRPSRTRSAKEPSLQAPTSASKPYAPIPRITLRRSAPSSPAPAAPSPRPTRTSSRPKPKPRLAASATPQGRTSTRSGGTRAAAPSTGSSRKRGRRDNSDEESDSDEVTEDFEGGRRAAVTSATPAPGGRALRSRVKKGAEDMKRDEERERRERGAMQEVIELSD
ncbi:hypothetical protein BDY24DRAFT_362949 [Mrakia frigida]|uniref:uncharacterized protein n=1 Tax=Mrakia frigida TaxID=29902 RepID=UPI003FCC0C5B